MNVITVPTSPRRHDIPTLVKARQSSCELSSSTLETVSNNEFLDNPNFAPPPTLSNNAFRPVTGANHLPKYDMIRHSGHIMTRFSSKAVLTKSWRSNFWILYGETFYFFRSQDDFEQWLTNPTLTSAERKALIKRFFVFKTETLNLYTLRKKRNKMYSLGGNIHHFKLNKHVTYGDAITDSLAGAFGSPNEVDCNELYIIMYSLLEPVMQLQHPLANVLKKDSFNASYDSTLSPTSSSGSSSMNSVQTGFSAIRFF